MSFFLGISCSAISQF